MDAKTIDNRIRRAFNGIRQAFRGKIARVKAAGGVQQIQVEGLEGETAVYNADGAKMVLKKGRIIEIDCETLNIKAPGGVNIDASNVGCTAQITAEGQINGNGGMVVKGGSGTSFTGKVKMVGDLDTTGKLTNNGKNVGSNHKHSETNGSETGEVV